MAINVKVSANKASAKVSVGTDSVRLTREQLLEAIRALGKAHAEMVLASGQIPPLEGARIDCVINTRWFTQLEQLTGQTTLSFQHPAYGAVGFVIPRDQVAKLIGYLARHLAVVPPPPKPLGRPN